jgi:hypothetical protein
MRVEHVFVHGREDTTMAGKAPQTQNWEAQEIMNPGGGGYRLDVAGEVEVGNTNETPHLSEHAPQGFNPAILMLDLTITAQGIGNTVMTWKKVRFEKPVAAHQYSDVEVLSHGTRVATMKVKTPK